MSDILNKVQTAADLYEQQKAAFLTTGCASIDKCLKGGIPLHSITEIVGEASAGKTQLALQLAINSILPEEKHGVNGKVLYIETESSFHSKRLNEMVEAFCRKNPQYKQNDITENIFVEEIRTYKDLLQRINSLDEVLQNPRNQTIRIIIIDSIAAVFRNELTSDYYRRAEVIRSLYIKMNELCQTKNLTFIITNQITSVFKDNTSFYVQRRGSGVAPALGSTVTQFTHNRYMLCRRGETYPDETIAKIDQYTEINCDVSGDGIRDFYIIFSPITGYRKTTFTVTKDGVVPCLVVC